MLEARLPQGIALKRILEAIKELVSDANFDCSEAGLALQAMDTSHVALVALLLRSSAFDPYRCDHSLSLGINIASFNKLLKCSAADDVITLKAEDSCDALGMVFESTKKDKISSYELKLMDIDSEHMEVPEDAEYEATVVMSSAEFQQICRDLSALSDSVTIEVTKEGVHFSATGELGSGCITIKQGSSMDTEMADVKDEEEAEEEEEQQVERPRKRRKGDKADEGGVRTTITMSNPLSLCYSLKYLLNFAKATPLSKAVKLELSMEIPLMVEFMMDDVGYLRYYLAPKIDE